MSNAKNYQIFETNTFQSELTKLKKFSEYELIRKKIADYIYPLLRTEPHYGAQIKKLHGYQPPTYRFRIGNFRLFYFIDEVKKTVVITSLRARKDAY